MVYHSTLVVLFRGRSGHKLPLARIRTEIRTEILLVPEKRSRSDHLKSRPGNWARRFPYRRISGGWSWYGQGPYKTSPEATSQSDNESRKAKELINTSILVHAPPRGDARDMLDQTDIRLECSGYLLLGFNSIIQIYVSWMCWWPPTCWTGGRGLWPSSLSWT